MQNVFKIIRPLSVTLLCFVCFSFACAEIVLVDDGQALCTIVMGEDDELSSMFTAVYSDSTRGLPSDALEGAAWELADYLNRIGWIGNPRLRVKVVKESREARTSSRVLLGTAAIEEYGLEEESGELGYSGYIYRTEGNDLLIFGKTSKGTANGVYGFLQEELGVRWYGPQELFTVVPRESRIRVGNLDRRVEPSFTGRFGMVYNVEDPLYAWRRRMRLAEGADSHNFRGIEPFSAASHYIQHIVPVHRSFDTNPEYFRKQGGERRRHPSPGQQSVCWTNPDVIEKAVAAARERFSSGWHYHTFSLAIPDSDAYCECAECVNLQPERYYRGRSPSLQRVASDMYLYFMNEAARRVGEEFPGRYLSWLAYNDVSLPPVGELEKNIYVCLVLDISEHYDPLVREQDMDLIKAWEEKGVVLGLYYYTGLAKLVPAYFPRHLGNTLQGLHRRGFRGLTPGANVAWPWMGPMGYVHAQLWWDADLDVDETLGEYFTDLYGPAAAHVEDLYNLFEEIHMRPRRGGFLYEHGNFQQFRPYTGEDLERMKELIAAAHAAIEHLGTDRRGHTNLEERRLAYVTDGLRLFFDMLEGVVLARELEAEAGGLNVSGNAPGIDNLGILFLSGRIGRVIDLIERHERVYRESILNDPWQANWWTYDTARRVRGNWKEYLKRSAGEMLVGIYKGIERSGADADRKAVKILESEAARYVGLGGVPEALFNLGTGRWKLDGPNLVRNPGFEETKRSHPYYPEHLEWQPSGADNWAFWQTADMGAFTVSDEIKKSGTFSGHIDGVGSGVLIGLGPDVKPGETYYFEAYVKNLTEPEEGTDLRFALDWLDDDNRWIHDRFQRDVDGFNEWIKVEAAVKAPENAGTAVIMFSVLNLPHGSGIYFDDVSLRRIDAVR